jgi:glutathione S-transferase
MKLYDEGNPAPNPRKVRIYLAEKGIEVLRERVRILRREHKAPEFLETNSLGQVPVLELDDGTHLSESVAICRYFEALHPSPPLFGRDAREQALIEMWIRRAEFRYWTAVGMVWRHADPRTAAVVGKQFQDFGESNKKIAQDALIWIDSEMADGREYLAGGNYSMADIVLLCGIDFGKFVGLEIPEDASHLRAWHHRVSARPSAAA